MGGIMMLADPDWFSYQVQNSTGGLAIFYASPHKKTGRDLHDPLFCVRRGKKPRSIVGVGRIQDQPIIDQNTAWGRYGRALGANTEAEWRLQAAAVLANSQKTYQGQMLAIELVDFQPFPAPISPIKVGLTDKGWGDKKEVTQDVARQLLSLLSSKFLSELTYPEEIVATVLTEGAVRSITVNAYERDRHARNLCIAAHGSKCAACDLDFGLIYGAEFSGYIHIHHRRPLSEIREAYVVDPVNDLQPVCPNCHAVIHHGGQLRTVEDVRQLLAKQRSFT